MGKDEDPASDDGEKTPTKPATSSVMKLSSRRARDAGSRPRTAFDRRRDGPLARPRWPVTARRHRPRVASRDWTHGAIHRPSQVKDEETPKEATPPAPALPKPKPKLSQEDKIKLGKALAPALKPSIKVIWIRREPDYDE